MPNYDLDANRELLLNIILGDVDPSGLKDLGVDIDVILQEDTFSNGIAFGIKVKVDRVGKVFFVKDHRTFLEITAYHADKERLIWQMYHSLARKMSLSLFEFDPRIGLPLNRDFPDCPLFDPDYIPIPFQKTLDQGYGEFFDTITTCHFCMGRIAPYGGGYKPGVWCGGNAGFAHYDCAPWVTPRR